MIAKVCVDLPAKIVDKLYDYLIPPSLEDELEVGMRVIVMFGPQKRMGYCLEIVETSDWDQPLKPIVSIMDLESYLTPELIQLAKDLREETATCLIRIIETMLPAALKSKYQVELEVKDAKKLVAELQPYFSETPRRLLDKELETKIALIRKELKTGHLSQHIRIHSSAKMRTVRTVRLLEKETLAHTNKQETVLTLLKSKPLQEMAFSALVQEAKVSASVIDSLVKQGIVDIREDEAYRSLFSLNPPLNKEITLNIEQVAAYDKIMAKIDSSQTFLLHGVTSSGKTEIYLKVIEAVIAMGKEVIFLVPEIALTPMMVSRFKGRFAEKVAILHSGLSQGEKFDEWRKIIRKEVPIVIGARSACFAPFTNLGALIVDECHESSYKQEDRPKYYAIDILKRRSETHQSPLILGSATPNIETYARVRRGHFELLELKKRAGAASMPTIELVDMKQEFRSGNTGLFSNSLKTKINETLERHEQVILLMNRRGFATFVICRECGHVFTCPECDITLVYHEADHTLKCHYCNHKSPLPKVCPKCQSDELRYFGSGTQKIEMELAQLFPLANVVRMDFDTTRTKNAHEILLNEFANKGDILLGTQMIAKGLDFPKVTLVGILQADGSLYHPDFRAPEKTFQLITQVAGRAGRRETPGHVVIQAFNPDHYAIHYSVENDYHGFYEHEMSLRRLAKYVPFYYLTQILFSGPNMRDLFIAAKAATKDLKAILSEAAIVLGPALPIVSRIKNRYLCQVLIKYKEEPELNRALQTLVEHYTSDLIDLAIDRNPSLG